MNRRHFLAAATASMVSTSMVDLVQNAEAATTKQSTNPRPSKPNIVLIICDDLGYGDLGCYGGKLETPNLDRLAQDGTLLTHCNTPHPTCSAARAALLTGRYAYRVGVSRVFFPYDKGGANSGASAMASFLKDQEHKSNASNGLPFAEKAGMNLGTSTIASMLKEQGYHTSAIGKWHLGQAGDYLPHGFGFDEYLGVPYSVDMSPLPMIDGTEIVEAETDRDTLTQRYTEGPSEQSDLLTVNPSSYTWRTHIPISPSVPRRVSVASRVTAFMAMLSWRLTGA